MKLVIMDFSFFASIIFYLPLLRKGKPSYGSSYFSAANTLLYPNNYTLFFNLN